MVFSRSHAEDTQPYLTFTAVGLHDGLESATGAELDALPFGVIGMQPDGTVTDYNRFESNAAGLEPRTVIGRNFFTEVALCTNNHLVAHRYLSRDEEPLDDTINYVFTFGMRPVRVRLRLLRRSGSPRMFLALQRA